MAVAVWRITLRSAFTTLEHGAQWPDGGFHTLGGVTHRYHPSMGEMELVIGKGVPFSVFALTACGSVELRGSKWELDGERLDLSTRGLSNEGKGGAVSISSDGTLAIFVEG